MTKNQLLVVLAAFFLAVGGLAAYLWMGGESGAAGRADAGYTLEATDRVLGNRQAKVVLIEYASPTCGACAAFHEQGMPTIKANYIDTGKILFIFRIYPRNPADGGAEKVGRCLPEDKYFAFIDLLFRNQTLWAGNDVHGGLVRLGRMAGLGAEQVDQCINNTAEDSRINAVGAEAERRYGQIATPTFILNGTKLNAVSPAELTKLIDAELAKSSAQ
ncbi:MAG TPA: thioredoxin domain-containing protein [Rhizomicrobium sp.]|nr:thioredoxin domain-containing protein [Rhizomicrobium sp.]